MPKFIIAFVCFTLIFACKQEKSSQTKSNVRIASNEHLDRSKASLQKSIEKKSLNRRTALIMPAALDEQMKSNSNMVLIDVRTPGEIAEGKIGEALEIDYRSNNFKDRITNLDKSKDYVVYCKSGGRSKKATDIMMEMGFENLNDLAGGYTTWIDYLKQKQQ